MTDKNIKKDNQFFCSNRFRIRNNHDFCEHYSSEFNNDRSLHKESKYSTLDLIEDLKREIQKYPEILSRIFPNRYNYNYKQLSLFWRGGKNMNYVSNLMVKHKIEKNFTLKDKDLNLLEERLRRRFGNRASTCFYIIKQYKDSKLSLNLFIELIELELGRISGDIKVTYGELAIILGKHEDYIYHIRKYILSQTNRRYNPDYKFDLETLQEFKTALRIFLKERVEVSIFFIEKYINLNPDLKEYLFERVSIKNPHYFESIDTIEKAYWFGFLCADVAITEKEFSYMIRLELKTSDRERLVEFARVIGFDVERIKNRIRCYYDRNGELKKKKSSYVQFKSRGMIKDLLKNELSSSASNRGLPSFVWNLNNSNLALAFLLGFYDGDGSWFGGRSAEIYSSNKEILIQIKQAFEIEYPVRKTKKKVVNDLTGEIIHRAAYRITLGAELFEKMIRNYDGSMERKRPPEFSIKT